eukprot:COSAG02_NODE_8933_length_2394_cov_7.778214_2_plen_97_part_00
MVVEVLLWVVLRRMGRVAPKRSEFDDKFLSSTKTRKSIDGACGDALFVSAQNLKITAVVKTTVNYTIYNSTQLLCPISFSISRIWDCSDRPDRQIH